MDDAAVNRISRAAVDTAQKYPQWFVSLVTYLIGVVLATHALVTGDPERKISRLRYAQMSWGSAIMFLDLVRSAKRRLNQ